MKTKKKGIIVVDIGWVNVNHTAQGQVNYMHSGGGGEQQKSNVE
jgi:hypothetical protein